MGSLEAGLTVYLIKPADVCLNPSISPDLLITAVTEKYPPAIELLSEASFPDRGQHRVLYSGRMRRPLNERAARGGSARCMKRSFPRSFGIDDSTDASLTRL